MASSSRESKRLTALTLTGRSIRERRAISTEAATARRPSSGRVEFLRLSPLRRSSRRRYFNALFTTPKGWKTLAA